MHRLVGMPPRRWRFEAMRDHVGAAAAQARSRAQQPPQPPAQQPPHSRRQPPRRRTAPAAGSAASRRASARGINYVRVDVIVTDAGQPVARSEAGRFQDQGRRQAADDRDVPVVKIDPIAQQIDGPPPREIRVAHRRAARGRSGRTSACSSSCWTTTTCAAATTWSVRKPLIDFIENQLAPADMVAIMYPLTPVTGLTFTRNRDEPGQRDREVQGPPLRLPAAQRVRGAVRVLSGADGRADPQPGRR